jgi:hypothetical protein
MEYEESEFMPPCSGFKTPPLNPSLFAPIGNTAGQPNRHSLKSKPVPGIAEKMLDVQGAPVGMIDELTKGIPWDRENSNLRRMPCSVPPKQI